MSQNNQLEKQSVNKDFEDFRLTFIKELNSARTELGISQAELSNITSIKQPVLSRIERGIVSPNINTVVKILYALGKKLVIVPIEQ